MPIFCENPAMRCRELPSARATPRAAACVCICIVKQHQCNSMQLMNASDAGIFAHGTPACMALTAQTKHAPPPRSGSQIHSIPSKIIVEELFQLPVLPQVDREMHRCAFGHRNGTPVRNFVAFLRRFVISIDVVANVHDLPDLHSVRQCG